MAIVDRHEIVAPNSPDGPVGTIIELHRHPDGSETREVIPPAAALNLEVPPTAFAQAVAEPQKHDIVDGKPPEG